MSTAFIDLLTDVREQAREQIRDMGLAVEGGMTGPDGEAFGDVQLSPADRIARFVDYAERGILDILLHQGSPKTYWMLIREFVSDMEHSPLMQPFPTQTNAGLPLTQLLSDIGSQMAGATNG